MSDATDANERRKHPRYPLSTSGTAWTLSRVAADPFSVTTANVSLGGLMLHTTAGEGGRLQVGDKLLLSIADPEGGRMLKFTSVVTWIRHGLANLLGTWAFGVRFVETDEKQIRILHDPAARAAQPIPEE